MTLSQLEQRLSALEKKFECFEQCLPGANGTAPSTDKEGATPAEQDLIPGVEYPMVLDAPPRDVIRLRVKVRGVERRRPELGLSDAEWESLCLEEDQ